MNPEARQAAAYAARQLGFSGMGVAPADTPQGDALQRWLADGCHADMQWMERHLPARMNPELVLPGVKSIIVLTYEYPRRDDRAVPGAIARYAQGEDYHKLLAPKLADIDETLQFYGGRQRCFSDSGPVSERFFASRAGLGWIGRNGLLVRPKLGSYCFLSVILTTLSLPADTPMPNRCGSCHRCEQACPAGALKDGRCDARRCLSYWTIEAHSPAPDDVTGVQGNRLYGCDRCQEVCPWNARPDNVHVDPHLLMPARLRTTPAESLQSIADTDFDTLFTASPIRRIGASHLRRNAETLRDETE